MNVNIINSFATFRNILNSPAIRNYSFKSDLKINWVRPVKIPCYKPEKSGDLVPMPPINESQIQLEFRNSKELETANETVKKLFTLEFAPSWKKRQFYLKETIDKVRRHPLDKGSAESRIARWTGCIRAMQEIMEQHPRNKILKVKLKELIDKRKKHLKYLRRWDYKKFEWLIENLNIVYKPPPDHFHWITRKESLRKLTTKYCEDLKNERLMTYKLQLEQEQPAFLQEKIASLEFIRNEQIECGAEVTVTQEAIDEVKKQLEKIQKSLKESEE